MHRLVQLKSSNLLLTLMVRNYRPELCDSFEKQFGKFFNETLSERMDFLKENSP